MTDREFTTREQEFMYDTLREIARTGDVTLAEKALAFIDTPYVRYVVGGPAASDDSPTGQAWHIQDTATGHGVIVNARCWYATEAEAQAAADKLNNGGAQ